MFKGRVILIVLFKKLGSVELIRAFADALVAVQALLRALHFLLPIIAEPVRRAGTAYHKAYSCALIDYDTGGAGHTIAAAAAELARELLSILFNARAALVGQRGRS